MIIDGKKIAQQITEKLKNQPKPKKFLAAILVKNPSASAELASKSFIRQKENAAKVLGIDFRLYEFPDSIKNDELRSEVLKIAKHKTCGGVLVQLPLPEHINKHYILNVIPREKDVDVLGERALGAFYTGRNPVLPPSVGTVSEILQTLNFELRTAKVAVVGLGFLVGRPVSMWLQGNPAKSQSDRGARAKEIILFDEGSDFLLLREVDLLITGVGSAGIIKPDMLKDEAIIIDFGYSQEETSDKENETRKIRGDLDISNLKSQISNISYTPTPGGTGLILVAKLMENFYALNAHT